jgi:hypothetical protein
VIEDGQADRFPRSDLLSCQISIFGAFCSQVYYFEAGYAKRQSQNLWRFFWDYGNTELGNQGVHMLDIYPSFRNAHDAVIEGQRASFGGQAA